jgi:hypothetical protein
MMFYGVMNNEPLMVIIDKPLFPLFSFVYVKHHLSLFSNFFKQIMKFDTSLLGISSLLLLLTNAVLASTSSSDETTFELVENFRESKNIMFGCMYGGSSHVIWVLSILEELSHRGHSTFFLTRVIG